MGDLANNIIHFFGEFIDMLVTAIHAIETFYDFLVDFDNRIIAMVDNCGSHEFNGFPINKAIATYHYAVGDIVFYLMYAIILAGCLFTIYKLLVLLYQGIKQLFSNIGTGLSSSSSWSSLTKGFFK